MATSFYIAKIYFHALQCANYHKLIILKCWIISNRIAHCWCLTFAICECLPILLQVVPTMMSFVMSFVSAIVVIGTSAEVYSFGMEVGPMWCLAFLLCAVTCERLFIPWLYPLKLTSVNEVINYQYMYSIIKYHIHVSGFIQFYNA